MNVYFRIALFCLCSGILGVLSIYIIPTNWHAAINIVATVSGCAILLGAAYLAIRSNIRFFEALRALFRQSSRNRDAR